ncbi:Protein RTM1 [Ceratobasidium theobromae]|uniref:Protein RTM1 n=1 Tax=Ceratobasidium theobromae TaxID=1582974 RepID=A0A5N5QB66_9AGAM|nr:Protein RTM1 [Ceratobasidium theobromae]
MLRLSHSTLIYAYIWLLTRPLPAFGQDNNGGVDLSKTPLEYIPSKTWAAISGSLYIFTVTACVIWSTRHWGRYMLAIMIGAGFYALGLFLRIVYAQDPTSVFKYATMNLIILLSPCGFIAGVYMLLSRLAFHLNAVEHLVLSPRWLTKIFVTSDIFTFFVQATGGGMTAMNDQAKRDMGKKLFLGGLIAQLISFIIYTLIFAIFVNRVRTNLTYEWNHRPNGIMKHWLALVISMSIACVAILIRSVFRALENGQGREGYLATHEAYFYVLDCFILWISVT